MHKQTKPIVTVADTLGKLDIRVGKIIDVELETRTPKPTYKLEIDFKILADPTLGFASNEKEEL